MDEMPRRADGHVAVRFQRPSTLIGSKPVHQLYEYLRTTTGTTNVLIAHITGEYLQRLHTKGASQSLRNGQLDEDRWSKPRVRR